MDYDLTIDAFYISIRNLEETVRYLGSLVSLQLFEKEFYNAFYPIRCDLNYFKFFKNTITIL